MATASDDYAHCIAMCEARLRLAGATCTYINEDSTSRYFNLSDGRRVRVSTHQAAAVSLEDRWAAEIRVDAPRWREELDALAGVPETTVIDMPSSVYFADHGAVSQSMLKVFADRRRLYEGFYVTHTLPEPPDSDPMRKGTATHTALLEPHRFERLIVKFPPSMLASNGAVSTKEAKAFRAEHEAVGQVVLKEADAANVRAMADSVLRVCGKWLNLPAVKEKALYWTDSLTGVRLKMRLDWLINRGTAIVFDLKTTGDASPAEFRKRIEGNGYWMQAAHYIEGVKAAMGVEQVEFYFIAVEDKPPHACALYSLESSALAAANVARRRVLNELHTCLATGDFSEPWEAEVTRLPLREFCFNTNQL